MTTFSSFMALPDDVLQRVLLGVALDDHVATAAAWNWRPRGGFLDAASRSDCTDFDASARVEGLFLSRLSNRPGLGATDLIYVCAMALSDEVFNTGRGKRVVDAVWRAEDWNIYSTDLFLCCCHPCMLHG